MQEIDRSDAEQSGNRVTVSNESVNERKRQKVKKERRYRADDIGLEEQIN
jgi:hypothetical protein